MSGAGQVPERYPGARPCWAEIDRNALAANIAGLRSFCGVPLAAVVKADAYGHGATEVAMRALDAGADWLAVALVEEGRALRDAGIEAPILLLGEPPPDCADQVLQARLTPTVYSRAMVEALARSCGTARVGVHLKVDTGMHRLGTDPESAVSLSVEIARSPNIEIEGIWTHLAAADDGGNAYTAEQLEEFDRVCELVDAPSALRHAANSAGAIYHHRARYSLVRTGIAIYGIPPSDSLPLPDELNLEPVLTWKAAVTHVKELAAGEPVGYGLTYRLSERSRILTIPVGYADGYFRSLGNRADVLIRGERFPVVGTISMDHITVNAGMTDIGPGEEVTLIGRQGRDEISASELAGHAGTISYEVVARIGKRVPRVYL